MTLLERAASAEVVDDIVLPFAVESLSTRGRLVRLGAAIDLMLKRHAYPEPVSKLVAEAVTLAALLGSTLKTTGRFQLQTKSDGPVTMLLVDFDAPSHLRALARFDKTRLEGGSEFRGDLLGNGHLAFTIDPGGDMNRYQGVIALEGQGLEAAAHHYFERSEQIPTLVRLAVGEIVTGERRRLASRRPCRPISAGRGRAAAQGGFPARGRAGGRRAAHNRRRRRVDRGENARGDDGSARTDRSDAVRRAAPVSLVQRARRARLCADSACGRLSLFRRGGRCDAALFSAGRGQGDGGRRRHDRRHLRILFDQTNLQPS